MTGEYIVPNDFRTSSQAEYCAGILLDDDTADDTALAGTIARMSQRIDRWTNDHFAAETGVTYDVDTVGGVRAYLPRRIRAATTVSTLDTSGNFTVQASTLWRIHSSLNGAGDTRIQDGGDLDWLEIIPGQLLDNVTIYPRGYYYDSTIPDGTATGQWPYAPKGLRILGDWSWTSTPSDIQRACALLVWDSYKAPSGSLRRASEWTDGNTRVLGATTDAKHPSGIPEVDEIITRYYRPSGPMVG